MANLNALTEFIKSGNRSKATKLTQEALDAGEVPQGILDAMVVGMDVVGERFKCNEIFVPEMLIAARAMKEAMAILEPALVKTGYKPIATAVIGTVQGDLHDIGKNLVSMMWKGASFNVVDLGVNVPAEKFVAAIKEHNATLVGLSALLTTTMPAMQTVMDAIRAEDFVGVKVLIGGAPITQNYADQIGADAFAADAASAVDAARKLLAN
ncbi:cobalamin-dependent protein [bacterium AH-315-I18]|nr:cobalamin-dependent protein [Phycisphaeraceae bacterium]MBN4061046.1 cobalamin-dependent protein [bacterium AH-315-I18]